MASGRDAALLAGLSAQLAVATVGVLPWVALPVTALLFVWVSRAPRPAPVRVAALLVLGAAAVLSAPQLVDGSTGLKEQLGVLLVLAQVAQATSWRGPRDMHVGLLAALGLLVLAASFAPDALIGGPILLGWTAVLVALAQLAGVRGRQLRAPVGIALVGGLVAFLLVPPPTGPHQVGGAAGAGRQLAGTRGDPLAHSANELDLRLRGALPELPVLEVPDESPALWRSAVYTSYTGLSWIRSQPGPALRTPGKVTVGFTDKPSRQYAARPLTGETYDLFAPGRLLSLTVDDAQRVVVMDAESLAMRRPSPYVVTVQDPILLENSVSGEGTDNLDPAWTALPPTVPARVRDLGRRLVEGAPDRIAAARAVTSWLAEHVRYSLDSPVPTRGEDAVDRVLFKDHIGFCEQFASAEVVLLRAAGVPARLVTGLAYGKASGGMRTYHGRDLHAWVELWVPGEGWVTSDPTASAQLADRAGARARIAAAVMGPLKWLVQIPGGRPALSGLLLVLALAAAAGLRRRGSRHSAGEAQPEQVGGSALNAFLRWDARRGDERRRPAESLQELAGRVEPAVAEALGVVEQEVYGAQPTDPRRAVEVLDRR